MIGGLVLAAGAGTRFESRGSKLLAPLDGRPLLEHAVSAACAVDALDRVVIVLGFHAETVLARVDFGRATPVVCPDWHAGQSASLRCGLAALTEASKVIVTLGDEPLITAAAITRFISAPGGTRATYGGRPGHPVVLGPSEIEAVAGLRGDRGARTVLDRGPLIECSDLCSDADVDTPDDLEAIRHEVRAVLRG